VHHAAIHPLTPGDPAYAVVKLGAIGSLVALKVMFSRRAKRRGRGDQQPEHGRPPRPHPVSNRKARRRKRRGGASG